MANQYQENHLTDEERRNFLKTLGIGSVAAIGSTTLDDLRKAVSGGTTEELSAIGQAIQADLAAELDTADLANQQSALSEAASALPAVVERGLPEDEPRAEFAAIAEAGRPIYNHLAEVGFFESTTQHLPEITPQYLQESTEAFIGSEALTAPLVELGFSEEEAVDLVATVIVNAEELSTYHWVATDQLPREQIEFGEYIPSMTQGAAGGALLWLEDLDNHLWQKKVILTDEIHEAATWHGRTMAAGYQLMTEGAKAIGDESTKFSDGELGALLSTAFALQAVGQNLLTQDVYWIDEQMRASRRTDLETVTEY
jgi:hypothetical protein